MFRRLSRFFSRPCEMVVKFAINGANWPLLASASSSACAVRSARPSSSRVTNASRAVILPASCAPCPTMIDSSCWLPATWSVTVSVSLMS